jgi:hypothetical protein
MGGIRQTLTADLDSRFENLLAWGKLRGNSDLLQLFYPTELFVGI